MRFPNNLSLVTQVVADVGADFDDSDDVEMEFGVVGYAAAFESCCQVSIFVLLVVVVVAFVVVGLCKTELGDVADGLLFPVKV